MEKDKLDLIKKIITLVDTKEGLKKVENAVDEVLRTQWDKEAREKKEFEQWRKEKNSNSEIDLPKGLVVLHAMPLVIFNISWR